MISDKTRKLWDSKTEAILNSITCLNLTPLEKYLIDSIYIDRSKDFDLDLRQKKYLDKIYKRLKEKKVDTPDE